MRLARLGPIVVAAALLGAATSSGSPASLRAVPLDARSGLPLLAPRAMVLSAGLAAVAGAIVGTGEDLNGVGQQIAQLRGDIQSLRKRLQEAQRVLERQLESAGAPPGDSTATPDPSASDPSTGAVPAPSPTPAAQSVDRTVKSRDRLADAIRELQAGVASLHGELDRMSKQLDGAHLRLEGQVRALSTELTRLRAERSAKGPGDVGAVVQIGAGQHLLVRLTSLRHDSDRLRADLASLRGELGSQEMGSADELAREAFADAAGIGDAPFLICPVDPPRSYSDDFGAPRWAGGFHTHQGNDIFAPLGTPVRAPFEGNAVDAVNGLGGLAVKVFGADGWVYNAHLSAYGTLGQVQAGAIIGYVGNTGDAVGTPPHDHFEWHPGGGAAVNPYPFLQQVC